MPKVEELSEKEFLDHVKNHQMKVLSDDGENRHIRFMQPGNSNRWFEIVTWRMCLVITGDMGSYMFSRLPDMFEFFRAGTEHIAGETLKINPGYWAEKLIATELGGHLKFSPELFIQTISNLVDEMDKDKADAGFRDAVEEEVFSHAYDGKYSAIQAAMEFNYNNFRPWPEFYEHNCEIYSYSFLWNCYAIAWAIYKYDQSKKEVINA